MKQYYIYLTTNLINNKKYIGKHFGKINDSYLGSGTLLKKAIDEYGKENFKKEILYISETEEENDKKEIEYIEKFNAVFDDNFYNIHIGGSGGNTTAGWSKERKEEYSKLMSEKYSGKGNPRYGYHLTEETKEKIRKNRNTDYMRTPEYREKMSKACSGEKNGMYGKHHTEESRKKMSLSHIGLAAGEKNGMYGKHHTEESRKKMSLSHIGLQTGEKNGMYGKKGANAINGKKIGMYDEDWNLIKIFPSRSAALEFLNMVKRDNLKKAMDNGTLYHGYYWKDLSKSVETN